MANELKHTAVGTELTQAEYEGTASHVFNSQATGDVVYASSATQLTRLGIGSSGQVLKVSSGGIPEWGTDTTNVAASALTGTTMASNVVTSSLTTVGALNAGSITSGFGTINNGSSAITTSGTVTGGTLAGTLSTATQNSVTTMTGLTSTGALNSGSITSGFGTINNGSSTITTTGAITGGSLDVNGGSQFDGTVSVGVDDTGYDVKFFGATAGSYMLWDESADDLILGGASRLALGGTTTTSYGVLSIDIDSEGTNMVRLGGTSKTSGTMAYITRNLASGSTDSVVARIRQDNTGDDQDTLLVEQDGTGNILTLKDGGTEVLEVADGGFIGINKSASSNVQLDMKATSTGAPNIRLYSTGDTLTWQIGATNTDAGYMDFYDGGTHKGKIYPERTSFLANGNEANYANLVIGHTSDYIVEGTRAMFQISGDGNDAAQSIARFDDGGNSPRLRFLKSRNATIGSNTLVQDGDQLGNIGFNAADGNDFNCVGARFYAEVDGTPGQDDMPTKLVFQTTPDGSASPSGSRMEIGADGYVGIGNVEADQLLHLSAGNSYMYMESTEASDANGYRGSEISFIGRENAANNRAAMGGIRVEHDGTAADHSGKMEIWLTDGNGNDDLRASGQGGTAALIIYSDHDATLDGTLTQSSDIALKTNINTIGSALDKVNQMRGVSFDRLDKDVSSVGLIAQELEKVAPELVHDNKEYKSVAYTNLTAYLIEAIKELSNKIKQLENK